MLFDVHLYIHMYIYAYAYVCVLTMQCTYVLNYLCTYIYTIHIYTESLGCKKVQGLWSNIENKLAIKALISNQLRPIEATP